MIESANGGQSEKAVNLLSVHHTHPIVDLPLDSPLTG